jgi:hypothetical protein
VVRGVHRSGSQDVGSPGSRHGRDRLDHCRGRRHERDRRGSRF